MDSSPEAATEGKPVRPEDDGVTQRFRFAIIPATLSFLLADLLAVGIVQAIEVATVEHEDPGRYPAVIFMMIRRRA